MFKPAEEKTSSYMTPGKHENIVIKEINYDHKEGKDPSIQIVFENATGQIVNAYLNFSDKQIGQGDKATTATNISMEKITHLWNRQFPAEQLNELCTQAGESVEKLASLLASRLTGKNYKEFKFSGREVERVDGSGTYFRSELPRFGFCSTDYSPRKVVFDESNPYDMRKLNKDFTDMGSTNHVGDKTEVDWS